MLTCARHIAMIATVALAGGGLSGCGTINEKLAAGVSDAIPAGIGGLPADAPPRPGTAKYDEYMREWERTPIAGFRTRRGSQACVLVSGCGSLERYRQSMNTTVLRPLRITRSSR